VTAVLALGSVTLVSLVSLVGLATLSMNEARVRRLATFFVSFAVGALLGDAFIHLVPVTFGEGAGEGGTLSRSLLILAGMMLFFVVEKLLRHSHGVLHAHHHGGAGAARPELAAVNVLGDAIHNFIDGVLIGASFLAGPALGLSTTLAVLLHEVPQELGDFAILVHSGLTVRRAVIYNLASASLAVLGTGVALLTGAVAREAAIDLLIPVTAGGFVYIAAADLVPELQHDRTLAALFLQGGFIALGVAIMALLTLLE